MEPLPQGTQKPDLSLLSIMTVLFAVLALDIAIPAVVLSLMALLRWLPTVEFHLVQPGRRTA